MDWTIYACLFLGLSSALVGGVFQSFSDFVMKSLVAAPPEAGIEVMQLINRKVFRSAFIVMFLMLVPLVIAYAVYAYLAMESVSATWIMMGAASYVASVFLVTMFGNVPMNDRLAQQVKSAPETELYWRTYGTVWTRWNHVRTIGCIVTAVCFVFGAVSLA